MKVWNLNVKRGADGSKHLDVQLHGVIDGGWLDEGVSTADLIDELNQHRDAKTIGVRINSVGGSAFGGIALYNALQSHPGEVMCEVEGLAASAASLVAMAGKCTMGRGAMMMIHKPSTVAIGDAVELRKTADFLDKVQDSLATVYTKKTGKSLDEINDLLDAETWMTADEAVAAGFADEVVDALPPAEPEPDQGEPDEGNEDERPEMRGDEVVWHGVAFPVARLPQQVLAMARKPAPPPAPVVAIAPPPDPQPEPAPVAPLINRAWLAERAPELLNALLEEGRAAGVAAERARLQAIDELPALGCAELVAAAKYGEKPTDAAALAIAIVKAQKGVGAEMLAARRAESTPIARVTPGAPDQATAANDARLINAMTEGGNATRGGKR